MALMSVHKSTVNEQLSPFSNLYHIEKAKRTRQDLNPQPTDPKSVALSIELLVQHKYTSRNRFRCQL